MNVNAALAPLHLFDKPLALHKKINFSIKDFFSKCDQFCSFLRIWSHLLKKSFNGKLHYLVQCSNKMFVTFLNAWTSLFVIMAMFNLLLSWSWYWLILILNDITYCNTSPLFSSLNFEYGPKKNVRNIS